MAIISSYGTLTAVTAATPHALSSVSTSGPFYDGYRRSYAQIYQTQPAVRTVIDFFARNIAQLGLHVFRRVSDTDRQRLFDHDLARVIGRPNPCTTRYRLFESTVQDIGIYANAYWLKVRVADRLGLVRLPAAEVSVTGGLLPTGYVWEPQATAPKPFDPSEIVHFRLFDPVNATVGFPPLETLRRVLAEEAAATDYRQHFWKNAARVESIIERPKDAGTWKDSQRDEFRRQWQEFAGNKAGMTPVLEDGMQLKAISQNFRDSEYISGRKLTREEVAAEYHVPLPMVGILDHATFSNVKEQHKQLYQDCLGPWLVMLEEDIELQLLPEFGDVEDVYTEFNIHEKLKGSFEEQIDSLTKSTGRPVMTVNEARARLNLPQDPDPESDKIARNLNQTTESGRQKPSIDPNQARAVLGRFFARQQARIEKQPEEARADQFDLARWDRELAADLRPLLGDRADAGAQHLNRGTLTALQVGSAAWPASRVDATVAEWLEEAARV